VEELVEELFGKEAYVRTDHSQSSALRHAAFKSFNDPKRCSQQLCLPAYVGILSSCGFMLLWFRAQTVFMLILLYTRYMTRA
jgi:hypothetical protein